MTDDRTRELTKIRTHLEALCKETARLRQDVLRLLKRIEPYDDEKEPPFYDFFETPQTFGDVARLIQKNRDQVYQCELAIGKVSAQIAQIVSDGWSREELKPYLKSAGRRDNDRT